MNPYLDGWIGIIKMSLKILKLDGLNAISIKQDDYDRKFITSENSFVISIPTLVSIINFLIQSGFMDYQILEGILEEKFTERIDYDRSS